MGKRNKGTIPEDNADKWVKALPFPEKGEKPYSRKDSQSKLIITVYPSTKTFRWRNTYKVNKPFEKIGSADTMAVEEARYRVRSMRKKLQDGKAPILDPEQHKTCLSLLDTFELAMKELITNEVNKPKSVSTKRSSIMVCGNEFYERTMDDFTARELIAKATWFRNKYSKEFFDNFHTSIFSAFDYAMRHNYPIKRNYAADIKTAKFRKKVKKSKQTDVPLDQIIAFKTGYLDHPDCPLRETHRRMLMLELYTGLRGASARLIEWTDIDWDNGWLVIPVEKQKHMIEHAESYQPVHIAITDVLLDILGIGGKPDGETISKYIWPSWFKSTIGTEDEKPYGAPTSALNHAFRVRAGDIKGIHKEQVRRFQKLAIPDVIEKFVPHEFGRHSFATLANEAKIPGRVVSIMMGHLFPNAQLAGKDAAAPTTSGTYIHSKNDMDELRDWWFIWAKKFCDTLNMPVPPSVIEVYKNSKYYAQHQIMKEIEAAFGDNLNLALAQLIALKKNGQLSPIHAIQQSS